MIATRQPVKPIGFATADARLYRLSQPISFKQQEKPEQAQTQYVVVSPSIDQRTGKPQTRVFPANSKGMCLSWIWLGEHVNGHFSPTYILGKLGYQFN